MTTKKGRKKPATPTKAKRTPKAKAKEEEAADTRKFLINSDGECFRGPTTVQLQVCTAARLDRLYRGDREGAPSHEEIVAAWDQSAREKLDRNEYKLYKRLEDLAQINNGRFRVYGWIDKDDRQVVVLVTEFCWWVEDPVFWDRLERIVKDTKAGVVVLHESPHCDQRGKPDPETGKLVWRAGFNHGRPERQVELSWKLGPDDKVHDVVGRMMALSAATAEVWQQAGVGVC